MTLLQRYYAWRKKSPPPYAQYSLGLLIWKPFRKFFNVVLIPNIPFTGMRVAAYRLLGYKIGKNVFIGMKCYLDDLDPSHFVVEDGVTISYGCYFSLHGKRQGHRRITIQEGVYMGMRASIAAVKSDIIIGKKTVIGAGAMVIKSVESGKVVAGVPAKEIGLV